MSMGQVFCRYRITCIIVMHSSCKSEVPECLTSPMPAGVSVFPMKATLDKNHSKSTLHCAGHRKMEKGKDRCCLIQADYCFVVGICSWGMRGWRLGGVHYLSSPINLSLHIHTYMCVWVHKARDHKIVLKFTHIITFINFVLRRLTAA